MKLGHSSTYIPYISIVNSGIIDISIDCMYSGFQIIIRYDYPVY